MNSTHSYRPSQKDVKKKEIQKRQKNRFLKSKKSLAKDTITTNTEPTEKSEYQRPSGLDR